jgi:hypothetical protein
MRFLILIGMIAIGVMVWKLLQKQERGHGRGQDGSNDEQDRFGW